MEEEGAIVKASEALAANLGQAQLLNLSEAEFEARLKAWKLLQDRTTAVKRSLMRQGVHFGVIPGTEKPTLLKPGAELLCQVFGYVADFEVSKNYGDGNTTPPIHVDVRCVIHVGDLNGPIKGVGLASANSWERRHRYRRGERACPSCGTVGSVIKGKADFGGGWLCWAKKGGCGAKFEDGDQAIVGQAVGDVENPDQFELENTLIKMAAKRAYLDATLRATASSDIFTQDLDEGDVVESKPTPQAQKKRGGRAPEPDPAPGVGCGHCGSMDVTFSHDRQKLFCQSCELMTDLSKKK